MKVDFEPKEVSIEEVLKFCRRGDCQLVDVRDSESCKLERIKGAKCIPLDELEGRLGELDRNKLVVAYCSGPQCPASGMAEKVLSEKGFCAVHYKDGLAGWKEAGYTMLSG